MEVHNGICTKMEVHNGSRTKMEAHNGIFLASPSSYSIRKHNGNGKN